MWIDPHVALEGSVTYTFAQTNGWYYSYLFSESASEITSDHDIPLVGSVRVAVLAHHKVGLDIVAGGGFSLHSATSTTIADCGRVFHLPCTPVTPTVSDVKRSFEPLVDVRVEVPIAASPHVVIAPAFRFLVARRRLYLTGYEQHGPDSGSGAMGMFGASVFWRNR